MESLVAALIGGLIGTILTSLINLAINHSNNQTMKEINENNAAWTAQREEDDAVRKHANEREVWIREQKEKAYNSIMNAGQLLKDKVFDQSTPFNKDVLSAIETIANPPIMVVAPRKVVSSLIATRNSMSGYIASMYTDEGDFLFGSLAKDRESLRNKFTTDLNKAVDVMREDLGFEELYTAKAKGMEPKVDK
ncbi:hypothetical protein DFO58_1312 [Arthrobacter sp. AG1021]|uniref:hypothetical protein n=1 Tax=Arthrobacter sp. AG1021 TaxID=2183908 RepID=UPI000EAC7AFC|nr:hypothetical protein [Arthrobacter sp. AG1021]RKS20778.1 hypothetical protein DFO58_1312 [Arthrobacter sp. AG1021]